MKVSRLLTAAICLAMAPAFAFAQTSIMGKIVDAESGEGLAGANIVVTGTSKGAASDLHGNYVIKNLPPGKYMLRISFIGYQIKTGEVMVNAGQATTADFTLSPEALLSEAVLVSANRAKERETPVAFTDVKKDAIETDLGSRDIPLVLDTTPSVYASQASGGAGDARVNVRGFNQRNIGILINGVPVNDMENGWVYWSNWDGVGDATSSIQVQRGMSAVNLATPSIGGTMNILTDPTALERGGKFKQELGDDGFLKSTLVFNSGLVNEKFAFSGALVRKTGDGLVDRTWTDAWAYYFGASYNINSNNRLELYALGAPQRHGQNLFKQNIAVYSHRYAAKLSDYDQAAFSKYNEAGRRFNQNWAPVSPSYTGKQAVENETFDRYDKNFIMERENFFHKPQVNLNWFSRLSKTVGLYSILYYSGGTGGGTGTYGSLQRKPFDPSASSPFASLPWTWDWDGTIARNQTNATGARGILRNSRNNQWTVGAISKATFDVSEEMKITAGVDWRKAEIEHYREVRDLLGAEYFDPRTRSLPVSDFWTEAQMQRKLGDKIDYNNTNTVDWIGGFVQGEYSSAQVSAYGMVGPSSIKYTYTDYFVKDASTGKPLVLKSDRINGYQAKAGLGYKVTQDVQLFGNVGYVSKVPIFDNVISDVAKVKATDPKNEKFTSFEAGVNMRTLEGKLNIKANLYRTIWKDRANSVNVVNPDGTEGLVFLTGVDAAHQGVEFEAAFQPTNTFRFDGAASIGDWKLTDDVAGEYRDSGSGSQQVVKYNYYVKDLKVGDQPQTQFALAGSVFPTQGLRAQLVFKHFARHWADWDPLTRTNPDDRTQSWKVPNYSVFDFHASYTLPVTIGRLKPQLFAHIFNLFNATFIQDAVDNSRFSSWDNDHDADDAEVYFGLPRMFNLGLQLNL